jgi:hypothetical protein
MADMTAEATRRELVAGWYGNNCHCGDRRCGGLECYQGDVDATVDFGFGSIKMDRAGLIKNASLFAALLNATGKRILIENNNAVAARDETGAIDCPMFVCVGVGEPFARVRTR